MIKLDKIIITIFKISIYTLLLWCGYKLLFVNLSEIAKLKNIVIVFGCSILLNVYKPK